MGGRRRVYFDYRKNVRVVSGNTPEELRTQFAEDGIEPYRADQVLRWLYGSGVRRFDAMTNLPAALRSRLNAEWRTGELELKSACDSADGTRKLELATLDDARIEAVLIPEARRQTLCVSSQVGCSLDCAFCATGRLGLGRNLRTSEIVDQVLIARDLLAKRGEKLTHVVFMGMGEPLLNFRPVVRALQILLHPKGLEVPARRVTVSTAGVVTRMAQLVQAVPVRLAVSLHATTDEVRDELVPLNRKFPLAKLLDACRALPLSRRDQLTFEYTLIQGVNDSEADAQRLLGWARSLRTKVNLIPLNEHPGTSYAMSEADRVRRFAETLLKGGVRATVRRPRGDDIYAACGQLGRLAPPSPEQKIIQASVR